MDPITNKMYMKSRLLTLILLFIGISLSAGINVIPVPQSVQMTNVEFDKSNLDMIQYVWDPHLSSEAYELHIDKKIIHIRYSDEAGRFYANQTLAQLAEGDVMYCGVIKDAPRYEWRGLMLDEARHFFGKEKVKEILDLMSRYKLNRLHWHLSDNQGWRIEIKAYPQLCSVGGVGCFSNRRAPARFYTQDEIREIISYAEERHIEIIPEIDMPGHALAFTKAFPELSAGHRTVNPAKEELYVVLDTIMQELADLFPGRYIHIGGDEVSTQGWRERSDIPAFMKRESIKSYNDIQKYFEHRLSDVVYKTGKTVIAWDDVVGGELDKDSTVIHWWRGEHPEVLEECFEAGYRTVICSWKGFYLDYAQDKRCTKGQLASMGIFNTLEKLYDYTFPVNSCVIGVQANLWTEWIQTSERLDYMLFPRVIALAEKAWSCEENIDYDSFLLRLENEYQYLDKLGVYYYDFRDFHAHPEPAK